MIDTLDFCNRLDEFIDFYTGVPDSLLKDFCSCLSNRKAPEQHIIAANEGNSVALAAGHFLASGKPACVYLQNSGLGNIVNPLLSLMDKAVYNIPMLMIVGWRGEPGKKDEPQHVTQGELTLPLLECMGVPYVVVDGESDISYVIEQARKNLDKDIPFALVIKKGTFSSCSLNVDVPDISDLNREDAIKTIIEAMPSDYRVVSTTGKISRELFELRENRKEGHEKDFLIVGSMGHTSQIALGAVLAKPEMPVCCLDGDGSVLMHMGSMAVNGSFPDIPMLHIILNNAAHDTVGGQPTAASNVNLTAVAKASGYTIVYSCDNNADLKKIMSLVFSNPEGMTLIEVKVAKGSRDDLGRPTISARDCRLNFQRAL